VSAERLPDDIGKSRPLGTRGGTKLFERFSVELHDDAVHAHVGLSFGALQEARRSKDRQGGWRATSSGPLSSSWSLSWRSQ
jgi:hypothetical protein